jgi:facilitated trehalose transporter
MVYGIYKASLPPLCAVFGALMIGWPMQRFGRKLSLIGLSIPFSIGFLIMGFTYYGRNKAQLYIGRIITGLMNGAATPASQIYVISYTNPTS